jgi:uncharacterized protein YbjT (DUF2867 family)
MRVAVIGGTGLIGARLVSRLTIAGHDVIAASRATGVDSYTGHGLANALDGVEVLIDVSNSGYLDEAGANEFFSASTLNLLSYGAAAGVRHHIALSIVGTERLARTEGGYFAAKAAQERLIRSSGRPFTIVHSTQFFEFIQSIADAAAIQHRVRVSNAFIQPIAADDIADAIGGVVTREPAHDMVEFAGPDRFRIEEIVREGLRILHDRRQVEADPLAQYFGTQLAEDELLPGPGATLAPTRFVDWLAAGGDPSEAGTPIAPEAAAQEPHLQQAQAQEPQAQEPAR